MKHTLLFLTILFVSFFEASNAQNIQWAFGIGSNEDQHVREITHDTAGNIIVTGYFKGADVDFDPAISQALLSSAGDNDIFVAKYTAEGKYLWSFRIGGSGNDAGIGVVSDSTGNIYVSGWFRGAVDFDPSANITLLTGHAETGSDPGFGGDAFLAKFNSNGNIQWAFNVGSTDIRDTGGKVLIAKNGDVLWTGSFTGSNIDFDPSVGGTTQLSAGGTNASFLARYNSAGGLVWAKRFGGASVANSEGRGIAEATSGDIYLTGHFDGTIDLNPGEAVNNFPSNGCEDFYVVKLTGEGSYIWGFNIGGTACDYVWDMDIDPSDNIYITGQYYSTNVDFNPNIGSNVMSSHGNADIYVVKYDKDANYIFSHSFGSTGDDIGFGILVQPFGYTVTGFFSGTVNFDPVTSDARTETLPFTSKGGQDIFVASYDLQGNYKNTFTVGSAGNDVGYSLTSGGGYTLYLGGHFQDLNVDFDPLATQFSLSSKGGFDGFLAKYDLTNVLPITLNGFNAIFESFNQAVNVKWKIPQSEEVDYFEVERSFDGVNFSSIKMLRSQVGTSSTVNYSYDDKGFQSGNNYYRLRVVEKDGHYTYSGVVLINTRSGQALNIFPNPSFLDKLSIGLPAAVTNERGSLNIINAAGQIVYTRTIGGNSLGNTAVVKTNNWAKGLYYVMFKSLHGGTFSQKVIKQ